MPIQSLFFSQGYSQPHVLVLIGCSKSLNPKTISALELA